MRVRVLSAAIAGLLPAAAGAAPASVTIAGSLQSELGCPGDWSPDCALTDLAFDPVDGVWQGAWSLPAGSWEYKAAIDGTWDVNYGANGQLSGPNLAFSIAAPRSVRFYYDDESHWVADSAGSRIVTAAGDFQSELGCPGDWQPDCLRSWLQDVDGARVYTRETDALPAGSYQALSAIDEGWDEFYGADGTLGGQHVVFSVPADGVAVAFRFDSDTNVLTVAVPEPGPERAALGALAGLAIAGIRRAMLRAP
jgi:hypothetical protein